MKIKINENFGIKTDKYNYILCKIEEIEKDGEKKENWRNKKYVRNFWDALETYKEYRLKNEDGIYSIEELLYLMREIRDDIEKVKNKFKEEEYDD